MTNDPVTCTKNADGTWTVACDGIAPVTLDSKLAYKVEQLAKRAYWIGFYAAQGKVKEALGL